VNEPLVSLHSKNTNNAKSEVRFVICGEFTIDSSTPTLKIHLNEHPISLLKKKTLKHLQIPNVFITFFLNV
jgi:hypothetical protein